MKINPNIAAAYVLRTRAYAQLKMNSQAVAELDAVLKLKSRDKANALNAVAWCRATCAQSALRNGRKAIEEATEACELAHWKNWGYIDTLAAACAETGEYEKAIKYEKQTLEMSNTNYQRGELQKRLALYQNHKPFRE